MYAKEKLPSPELPSRTLTEEPWRKALRDAAELIRTRGWCQGEFEIDGTLCALGALHVATTGTVNQTNNVGIAAAHRLAEHLDIHASNIAVWNDQKSMTSDQVENHLILAANLPGKEGDR